MPKTAERKRKMPTVGLEFGETLPSSSSSSNLSPLSATRPFSLKLLRTLLRQKLATLPSSSRVAAAALTTIWTRKAPDLLEYSRFQPRLQRSLQTHQFLGIPHFASRIDSFERLQTGSTPM